MSECMVQCATSAVVHTQRMSLSKEDEYVGPGELCVGDPPPAWLLHCTR